MAVMDCTARPIVPHTTPLSNAVMGPPAMPEAPTSPAAPPAVVAIAIAAALAVALPWCAAGTGVPSNTTSPTHVVQKKHCTWKTSQPAKVTSHSTRISAGMVHSRQTRRPIVGFSRGAPALESPADRSVSACEPPRRRASPSSSSTRRYEAPPRSSSRSSALSGHTGRRPGLPIAHAPASMPCRLPLPGVAMPPLTADASRSMVCASMAPSGISLALHVVATLTAAIRQKATKKHARRWNVVSSAGRNPASSMGAAAMMRPVRRPREPAAE
mmetsp:Transcript_708/g.2102  ORF Transcript_708/g.2102 Transcript_708/m.2102 type:complete len:271 (+) Transcript_708:576-1388(+)